MTKEQLAQLLGSAAAASASPQPDEQRKRARLDDNSKGSLRSALDEAELLDAVFS
jgi:hypothetical protein